jgi:hypothetical protein
MEFAEKPKDGRFLDLTGQKFDRLTVIGFAGMLGNKRPYQSHWYCRCDGGVDHPVVIAKGSHLKDGNIKSCGCLKKEERHEDLTGKQFGHWTVLGFGEKRKGKNYWLCCCDCAEKTERMVFGPSLVRGLSTSCNCHKKIQSAKNMRKLQRQMRSEGRGGRTTHNASTTPEYKTWSKIKERCLNPNTAFYEIYGGRGITICERWIKSFEDFLADVGPKPSSAHSMDRIDVNGNYEPGNVRWATRKEQANNTRRKQIEQFSDDVFWAEAARRKSASIAG